MQLEITETKAESTMDLSSSTMKINMNAAAYNAILEKLYQDPLSSVIREISTNAYEANLMSGTVKPFLIQMPTMLKPELIIRDFGPGLDDKEIDKYLNTIFSSSKSGSNDFAGGFGLTR
jgi:sensor histidine kinase regulating citrate/malate metabolism